MGGKKLVLFFIFKVVIGYSQSTAKDSIKLEEVIVSITKIKDSIKNTPYSISANDYSNFQNNAQQFYLSEYIERIPGIFISNDNNFAQDSRISIRGFGSRANFGINAIIPYVNVACAWFFCCVIRSAIIDGGSDKSAPSANPDRIQIIA